MASNDLHLPRILCLHGGGTNATIFRAQCRTVYAQLKGTFRLCFAQAPLPSEAGPDVLSVYKDFGPFKAWIPPVPSTRKVDSPVALSLLQNAIETAMETDDEEGASGPWVAILGFSQGAKVGASYLMLQQLQGRASPFNFKFGILMAGRGPMVALQDNMHRDGEIIIGINGEVDPPSFAEAERVRLKIPTLHVHGLKDPNIHLHRRLLTDCCEAGTTTLIEWDGDHRLPFKTSDVKVLVDQILALAKQTGVQLFP